MFEQFADYDDHSLTTARQDASSGLRAIIAIHNDSRGPAIGGCRIRPYASFDEAMTDVLRLSRGMTYKTAIAGIPYGGGKAVIIADPRTQKSTALLHAMGDFVESLGGRYITSFDAGTTLADVATIGERTAHVGGTLTEAGDASESTARGVFECLKVAVERTFGSSALAGIKVAVQGVGNVGGRLAAMLADAGAELVLADVDAAAVARVADTLGARVVPTDDIHSEAVDVFSPCALGGILSERSIPEIRARTVVGGANNPLAVLADDARLKTRGILYCPDYLANAGGIVDLHYQRAGWSRAAVNAHVDSLGDTFREVIDRAAQSGRGTGAVADEIAEERFGATKERRAWTM